MKPDERKRRFNEAIVNTLYPPSPQHGSDSEPVKDSIELESYTDVTSGSISISRRKTLIVMSGTLDDCENVSTSGEEEEDGSKTEKLTRAQRKRIRKKKMKEESIFRGKLIGPLMPQSQLTQLGEDHPPPVRSNASQRGDDTTLANAKKMKQRRMAKRADKEKPVVSPLEKCNQISSDAVDEMKEARSQAYVCSSS